MAAELPQEVLDEIARMGAELDAISRPHAAALVRLATRAVFDIEAQLRAAVGRQAWREAQLQANLRRLYSIVEAGVARAVADRAEVQLDAARNAATSARASLERIAAAWARSEGTPTIVRADLAASILDSTLLETFATSRETWGTRTIGAMKQDLSLGQLRGDALAVTWEQMAERLELKEWQAERIARTEHSFAVNRRQDQDFRAAFGNDLDAWRKQLVSTFDARIGKDSVFVHNQVRRINEPFEDNEGRRYMLPPNRPQDREVVVYVPASAA